MKTTKQNTTTKTPLLEEACRAQKAPLLGRGWGRLLVLLLFIIGLSNANAQVGIGTTDPHASAALELKATDKGLLLTPQTTTAIDGNIVTNGTTAVTAGILVYDDTIDTFKVTNTDEQWVNLLDNTKVAVEAGTPTADTHSVGIGVTAVDVNATLDISVSGKGLLLPRLGSDPANVKGMMYYNDADNEVRYYNGTAWVKLGL